MVHDLLPPRPTFPIDRSEFDGCMRQTAPQMFSGGFDPTTQRLGRLVKPAGVFQPCGGVLSGLSALEARFIQARHEIETIPMDHRESFCQASAEIALPSAHVRTMKEPTCTV